MAATLQGRCLPSLVNFNDEFIFVSGGEKVSDLSIVYKTVDAYNINKDTWSVATSMCMPRIRHSKCALSSHIYVFCGYNSE